MNLDNIKKIYFIGIGGIGMSAAAGIARAKGFEVSGSDAADIYQPSKGILDQFKIDYKIGYNADNFQGADLVVVTTAVDNKNPELVKAINLTVPIIGFAELLGTLTIDKNRIVVVGTHGKGTTSGLISYALKNLNDSGFFVGGVLNNFQTNFYFGKGKDFVLEGDEYKSTYNNSSPKFSYYFPNILLINNIEFDHPDLYPTLEAFKEPFHALAEQMPETSLIVYNADDQNVVDVIRNTKARKLGFGFSDFAEIKAHRIEPSNGTFKIKITWNEALLNLKEDIFSTQLPGLPYAYDNLAAIAVLISIGFSAEQIKGYTESYTGIKRRYEIIENDEIAIIDDYAHHPTAVRQTLEATRQKYPQRRIICFFEPHTYSRTRETLDQLAKAFNSADLVYLAEVYPAREQKLPSSISSAEVVEKIIKNQPNVIYVKDKVDALEKFKKVVKKDDVIVVMAVGSFNTLVYDLKDAYKNLIK
ncbi:MAG: UDP-N-acetylmuramate--L-alanine ligase [Candidatus Doudnabacteria bacterium]|nr:UDP-N-acetylmuramate--L-alanine ligase [Candidatus Doudnabacteria bacterium]